MDEKFEKEIGLLSIEQYKMLKKSNIILLGLGGVGGYVFEGLIRSGIENFVIVDKDKFEISNFNRQLGSKMSTIGQYKTFAYKNRAFEINQDIKILNFELNIDNNNYSKIITDSNIFFNNINNNNSFLVIDCIDDINAKIEIINYCNKYHIYLLSCMGTANHIESKNINITNIMKTKYCPLAKKIRNLLDINTKYDFDVLYFDEPPIDIKNNVSDKRNTSTISYIPAIAGLKIAEHIITKIINF